MKQPIRLGLLLSVTALFASACTPVPFENQNTASYGGSYSAPTPAAPALPMNTAVTTPVAPVPEAGPLSTNNYAATAPQTLPANVPAANGNPTPVATVPQVPATNVAVANTNSSPYDSYAANNTYAANTPVAGSNAANNTYNTYAANANTSSGANYDYSGTAASINNTYTSYGTGTAASTTNNYAATSTGNNYYSGGNDTYAAANTSNASASGSAAVQVFATISQAKAESIRQEIASQGLNAIVDQVDGLYKVRVPYSNRSQAQANLTRVRHVSGTPGAFVTTR